MPSIQKRSPENISRAYTFSTIRLKNSTIHQIVSMCANRQTLIFLFHRLRQSRLFQWNRSALSRGPDHWFVIPEVFIHRGAIPMINLRNHKNLSPSTTNIMADIKAEADRKMWEAMDIKRHKLPPKIRDAYARGVRRVRSNSNEKGEETWKWYKNGY